MSSITGVPGFTSVDKGKDIAVLRLSDPLTGFGSLPLAARAQRPAAGTVATIAGWGTTSQDGGAGRYLMKAKVSRSSPTRARV